MTQIAIDLDQGGDIELDVNGDIVYASGDEQIRQLLRQRLLFWVGEWFLDESIGLWQDDMLGARVNIGTIESRIKRTILNTPGVISIESFSIDTSQIDTPARTLGAIDFCVTTDKGLIDFVSPDNQTDICLI